MVGQIFELFELASKPVRLGVASSVRLEVVYMSPIGHKEES